MAGEQFLRTSLPEERHAFLLLRLQIEMFEYAIKQQDSEPKESILWDRITEYYSKKTNYQICLH